MARRVGGVEYRAGAGAGNDELMCCTVHLIQFNAFASTVMFHRMLGRLEFLFPRGMKDQYGFIFASKVILGNESPSRFMCILIGILFPRAIPAAV